MTTERQELIDKFLKWVEHDPNGILIASKCATIAEEYCKNQLDSIKFEEYATFCIECDRKDMYPLKYKDYLQLK